VSEDVLRTIWMQRLPTSMQQILSVSNDNLDGLSLIADKVNEVSHFDTVVNSVASDNSVIQSFRDKISELRAELRGYLFPDSDSQAGVNMNILSPVLEAYQIHVNLNLNVFVGIIAGLRKRQLKRVCWYHRKFAQKAT
ncbi:hypothetical protein AVEN_3008-1, partial [Araneus ventricosus]